MIPRDLHMDLYDINEFSDPDLFQILSRVKTYSSRCFELLNNHFFKGCIVTGARCLSNGITLVRPQNGGDCFEYSISPTSHYFVGDVSSLPTLPILPQERVY